MTGIFNRRHLMQLGAQALKRACREKASIGIIMIGLLTTKDSLAASEAQGSTFTTS
jgi:PleD family two-component response regulator